MESPAVAVSRSAGDAARAQAVAALARDQHQRVLSTISAAKEKRADLERRLAELHANDSICEEEMRAKVTVRLTIGWPYFCL